MGKKPDLQKFAKLVQVEEDGAGTFYDRIAKLYDFSFKFNG